MKITTPNPQYNGETAGVRFVNGKGETDDPRALAYFERRGYTIEPDEPVQVQVTHPATTPDPADDPAAVEAARLLAEAEAAAKLAQETAEGKTQPAEDEGNQDKPIEVVSGDATAAPVELVGEKIEDMGKDALKDALRKLSLPVSGSKEELIARLTEARNG